MTPATPAGTNALPQETDPSEPTIEPGGVPEQYGEPFHLPGNRLVFTDWTYVRPCDFGWYDDRGVNVAVVGDHGPTEAEFRRLGWPWGIRIVAQPAQRSGPVLTREFPWEANRVLIGTLIRDGGVYRAWGYSSGKPVRDDASVSENLFCYLESDDGYTWRRPLMDLARHNGRARTNLLPGRGGTVFVDPSAPPEERYKWIGTGSISREVYEACRAERPGDWDWRCERPDVGHIYGVLGGVSPDGLNWTDLQTPLALEHSDTQLVAYYDTVLRRYVSYTRYWPGMSRPTSGPAHDDPPWWAVLRRSIGRSESPDFRRFPVSTSVIVPGADVGPSEVYYTNSKTVVPGAPNQHVMFPAVWDTSRDTTRIELWSSVDGRTWNRVPDGSVLETAPFGQWDGGCVFAHPNLVELPDGSFALPYSGYDVPHKYPRGKWRPQTGYALWPHGRLTALEAQDCGEFTTPLLYPPGKRLFVNARTARAGSVRVALLDRSGAVRKGYGLGDCVPVVGDWPRAEVVWRGAENPGLRPDEPVMLLFRLEQAELFTVEFA